jgi:urease gamma subunit
VLGLQAQKAKVAIFDAAVAEAEKVAATAAQRKAAKRKAKPISAKKQKTAAMVALMVLQQNATGKASIPAEKRYAQMWFGSGPVCRVKF